ncbi:MAG: glutathione S-transferase N-terminal domain-containing protein [Cocleimonas sp.]
MITLYQFQACPFCSKVRALLTFIKQPYEVVEVTPRSMKELKGITEHRKVPVLTDGDQVIVESATIIEHINTHYAKLPINENDKEWTDWLDKTLVHYLPPLVYPDFKTAYANIKTISPTGGIKGLMIPFFGALIMPKVAQKMKDKHNIKDPQAEFLTAIDHWVDNGLKGQDFFNETGASFVDCSVFGVLNSVEKLGTVDLAKNHNPVFSDWYARCLPLMT